MERAYVQDQSKSCSKYQLHSKLPITFRTFSNAFTKTSVFCSALLRSKAVWIYWLNSIRKGRSFRWLENQFSKTTKWTQISMVVKIWFYLSTKLNYVYCGVKPIYMGMSVWFGLVKYGLAWFGTALPNRNMNEHTIQKEQDYRWNYSWKLYGGQLIELKTSATYFFSLAFKSCYDLLSSAFIVH